MARINANDMEKYQTGENNFFKLDDDGKFATVQIMAKNLDDLDVFSVHEVETDKYKKLVDCVRESYDSPVDDCPLCSAGIQRKSVLVLFLFDHETQTVKIWQRGPKFLKKIEMLCSRYENLEDVVIDIERRGKKGDWGTTYEILPRPDVEPYDLSEVEKPSLDKLILEKSADDMQYYLDNNKFPDDEQDNQQPSRRSGGSRHTPANGQTRRKISRRVAGK